MTRPSPAVTILIHRDGSIESRSYRVPLWAVRVGSIIGVFLAFILAVGLALYTPIVRTAARVPFLTREVARLTAENQQVSHLSRALDAMQARYELVRGMLGGNVIPDRPPAGGVLPAAHPLGARLPNSSLHEDGASTPHHWPLEEPGVVTRGQVGAGGSDETHPGIDIAVPTGTPIRAAGGGQVAAAGQDAEYGLFVLIGHPDGFQSMYGHASRLLVIPGADVRAGQVIALSGSTGRSTAPHLHFEIRRGGRSLDPRAVVAKESAP